MDLYILDGLSDGGTVVMAQKKSVVVSKHAELVTLKGYVTGFVASLICTITAFTVIELHVRNQNASLSAGVLMVGVAVFVLVQFMAQARYFLHIGAETKPRIKLLAFYFMMLVVVIVVFGSIWIMQNLDYHMHMPTDVRAYMDAKDSL